MAIYDYSTSSIAGNITPPQYRQPIFLSWLIALMSPLQWLRDLFFNSYVSGSPAIFWALTTFPKGTRVRFNNNPTINTIRTSDHAVYEALKNTNNVPSVSPDWVKIQNNWVGTDARAAYNGQKLILEFAINQWFDTTFRQPDDAINPTPSDIFITEEDTVNEIFIAGDTNDASAASYDNGVATEFVGDDNTPGNAISRKIHVPNAVYNALGTYKEEIIRAFVDQYNLAGVLYSVVGY